ncbi:MAG: inorganic diphosphatase [Pseudomonadota bacterium]
MIRPDAIALGAAPPDDINVIVTVPAGSEPFEVRLDDVSGALVVSQLFHTAMRTPGALGVVPHTRSEDADLLQAVIVGTHPLASGMVIAARPVGVLYVAGEGGETVTVLAVPASRLGSRYDDIEDYKDFGAGMLRQFAHFFTHFRDVDGRRVSRTAGWGDVDEARRVIIEAAERARQPMGFADR